MSTTQLLSVPYALYAGKSGSAEETDPIFETSPAYGITNVNKNDWNTAFSWGNHAGLYKPLSYQPAWSEITNKPITIAGLGITDAATKAYVDEHKVTIDELSARVAALESGGTGGGETGTVTDADGNICSTNWQTVSSRVAFSFR